MTARLIDCPAFLRALFVGAVALTGRARIQFQWYVAGRRVNVLLASSDCAPY